MPGRKIVHSRYRKPQLHYGACNLCQAALESPSRVVLTHCAMETHGQIWWRLLSEACEKGFLAFRGCTIIVSSIAAVLPPPAFSLRIEVDVRNSLDHLTLAVRWLKVVSDISEKVPRIRRHR